MKCFESVACLLVCVCKQKTAYEMRISYWSSDVCSSDLTRGRAKTINFAILYGISAFGLAGRLGCDRGEAQAIIDRYFDRFPGIRNYIAETLSGARESGYVTTLFGRRTHFPNLTSKNMNERMGSERAAINAPIQGTSADIIKRAKIGRAHV